MVGHADFVYKTINTRPDFTVYSPMKELTWSGVYLLL